LELIHQEKHSNHFLERLHVGIHLVHQCIEPETDSITVKGKR